MHARHIAVAVLAAAVTLISVASAGPAAAKQRVAITSKGVVNAGAVGKFVFTPLRAGALKAGWGTESASHTSRVMTRDGQRVTIQTYVTRRKGKLGTFVIRSRVEYVDAGNGYHVGTNTWKLVSGTGQYSRVMGGGRGGDVYTDGGRWSDRFEGFLTSP
jgi:hypothetical protein